MNDIINIVKKKSDTIWEIPADYKQGMNVPVRIYATKQLLKLMDHQVIDQITNVATLPGIINYAYTMPDAHSGYGFPIGGVAAFRTDKSKEDVSGEPSKTIPATSILTKFAVFIWPFLNTPLPKTKDVILSSPTSTINLFPVFMYCNV